MDRVTSKDGTLIAYTREGSGPAVVLVGGAIDDGSENAPLAPELAENFTVYNYARRGRGESGDTPPYAVQREIEDLAALIAEAGGSARVFGASSGGGLALEAVAAGLAIDRLAVYEVPYNVDENGPHWNRGDVAEVAALLAESRRGDVVELFMRAVGSSEEDIAGAKASPYWAPLEALAHTLAYDAAIMGDGPPPAERLAKISRPTLVATGTLPDAHGGVPPEFMSRAADVIAASIPQAERQIIQGAGHMVDAKLVAPVLERFFRG
jgi:alpha-beta hydrolase superfamily lysophospholipase